MTSAVGAVRARWSASVERHPLLGLAWSVVEALRPAWWALRAWVAVTALDQATGPFEQVTVVPHFDVPVVGPVLLAVAVVVSVLIGQDRLWPGSGRLRHPVSRLVLVVLNILAALVPCSFHFASHAYSWDGASFSQGYARATDDRPSGLSVKGRLVTNLFAYDLSGNPLEGVQLVDQLGRPITLSSGQSIAGSGSSRTVGCPWFNGTSELYDVFPLQQQLQRGQRCRAGKDAANPIEAGVPPLAQVPPVTRTPAAYSSP